MPRTKSDTIKKVTHDYLSAIDKNNPPLASDMVADILDELESVFTAENQIRKKNPWKMLHQLIPPQLADVILTLHHVRSVACGGLDAKREYDILCIYQDRGENEGIYVSDESVFKNLISHYCYDMKEKDLDEVLSILKRKAVRTTRCENRDLIAVNNGIFEYKSKQLLPFTPDEVFLSKSRVDYVPNAQNPILHNDNDNTDWDIESWVDDLFDGDKEMVELIFQILGAIVRPNVNWSKSAWFVSEVGNNGKGCLCKLMRELAGKGSCASVPLSDFNKDFLLEPLCHSSAIIVDENDVGTYIDKAANLKAIITQDIIQINRKFKTPINLQFKGFMVQCLNEEVRLRDKSDSFYRRQLYVRFTKSFTGIERKYIKDDYLERKEVLEYVMCKVLNMNYYVLNTPKACKIALEEYKEFNDPVRQFMSEIMSELVWDLVPYKFLFDLFSEWYKKSFPNQPGQNSTMKFKKDFVSHLGDYPDWTRRLDKDGKDAVIKPANRMDKPEPLIAEYNLTEWMSAMYRSSSDTNKRCMPDLKLGYKGILRV